MATFSQNAVRSCIVAGAVDTIGSIAGQIFGAATTFDGSDLLGDVAGAHKVTDIADRFALHVAGV